MSHHQSITQQQDNRIILPLNLHLIDDSDSDSDSDSGSDYEDVEIDSDSDDDFDDEIEVYDDEIDDIEEEELEEEGEVTSDGVSSVSVSGLDDGVVVVNGDGDEDEEGLVSNSCGRDDGLSCPICFEGWTSGGEHQMCCLPCGHIYGLSCINKWLQRFRGPGKCPQCKNLCTLKGVRVLYASRLCAADEELHERVRALEAKCAELEAKCADLEQKVAPLTAEELIDQICSNPALLQRLTAALAELNQQQAVS